MPCTTDGAAAKVCAFGNSRRHCPAMPGKTKSKTRKDGPKCNAYWLELSPQELFRCKLCSAAAKQVTVVVNRKPCSAAAEQDTVDTRLLHCLHGFHGVYIVLPPNGDNDIEAGTVTSTMLEYYGPTIRTVGLVLILYYGQF